MTIRTLLATIALCGSVTLSGCSTKEAARIDLAPPATALTTTTATPAAGAENGAGDPTTDAALPRSASEAGSEAGQKDEGSDETRLDTVYFDFDAYLLSADARATITRNAHWLGENRLARIVLEGHADERGSDDYNLALAEKRAFAVRRYLETLGVDPDRLETISYGEDKPALAGHDEAGWAKNRRVEFVIVK